MISTHDIHKAVKFAKVLGTSRTTHVVCERLYYVVDDDSDEYCRLVSDGNKVVDTVVPVYKEC